MRAPIPCPKRRFDHHHRNSPDWRRPVQHRHRRRAEAADHLPIDVGDKHRLPVAFDRAKARPDLLCRH
jgi:hypothetical protein